MTDSDMKLNREENQAREGGPVSEWKPVKPKVKKTAQSMPQEDYMDGCDDCMGICLCCGETQSGCEPDARGYECESCEENSVYGYEEALIMGMLSFD